MCEAEELTYEQILYALFVLAIYTFIFVGLVFHIKEKIKEWIGDYKFKQYMKTIRPQIEKGK